MDNKKTNQRTGQSGSSERPGYETPGRDAIEQSTSAAIPSPTETTEQRIQAPQPAIKSINETPGDANPALAQTIGEEQGTVSTADMLRARESAEERGPRRIDAEIYQEQPPQGANPSELRTTDSGRPNWPNDQRNYIEEEEDFTNVQEDFMAGTAGESLTLAGRADAVEDQAGRLSAAREGGSGLPPVGFNAAEDTYEQEEMRTPTPDSDLDRIAPGMINLPPDNDDER